MSQQHFLSRKNFQNISDYSVIDIINYGSFGVCYKIKRKSLNEFYIWKAIDYGAMSNHDKQELQVNIKMEKLQIHSNIMRFYGTIIHEDSETLYAIIEYCHYGDLDSLMNSHKLNQQLINEKFIWKVLYQTSKAIAALHRTVSYMNIKPSNIFLDKHFNVKLADCELQKILVKSITLSTTLSNVRYPSPEQIRGITSEKTDVWALGCLMHEMCTLQSPFIVSNVNKSKVTMQSHKLTKLPTLYSDNLDNFIKLLINFDENLRPSVDTIIHHPTVICSYNKGATPVHKIDLKSIYEKHHRDIVSSTRNIQKNEEKDDIEGMKNGGLCVRPPSSLFFDPKKVTEDIYNEKFFNRLKLLRVKETALKAKENNLKSKELYLNTIETNLVRKQKLMEKREREIKVLHVKTETNTYDKKFFKTNIKFKKHGEKFIDLESTTCSADPGDTSVMPTAAKLDPSKIIKPSCFQKSIQWTNTNQYIEPTCVDKHSIINFLNHQPEKSQSYGTLKKCKQLILKK